MALEPSSGCGYVRCVSHYARLCSRFNLLFSELWASYGTSCALTKTQNPGNYCCFLPCLHTIPHFQPSKCNANPPRLEERKKLPDRVGQLNSRLQNEGSSRRALGCARKSFWRFSKSCDFDAAIFMSNRNTTQMARVQSKESS